MMDKHMVDDGQLYNSIIDDGSWLIMNKDGWQLVVDDRANDNQW